MADEPCVAHTGELGPNRAEGVGYICLLCVDTVQWGMPAVWATRELVWSTP